MRHRISLHFDLTTGPATPISRESVKMAYSPDLQTLLVPIAQHTPLGLTVGLSPSKNFKVEFLVASSQAEVTCVCYLPFVCYEKQNKTEIVDMQNSDSGAISEEPMTE